MEDLIKTLTHLLDSATIRVQNLTSTAHESHRNYAEGVRDGLQCAYDAACRESTKSRS